MLSSGTLTRNYLMPQTDETLKDITSIVGDFELEVVGDAVTAELADNITDEQRKDPKNYTPVLNAPFYPFENPWAATLGTSRAMRKVTSFKLNTSTTEMHAPGWFTCPDREEPLLHGMLPDAQRRQDNRGIHGADWEGETYPIEFNYPSYDNPIAPWVALRFPKEVNIPNRKFIIIRIRLPRSEVTRSASR